MNLASPLPAGLPLLSGLVGRAEPMPEPVAVLGFELIDEAARPGACRRDAKALGCRRSAHSWNQGLVDAGLYRVVDTAPARGQIDAARAGHALFDCNGCLAPIAQLAQLVIVGWVQRVSG